MFGKFPEKDKSRIGFPVVKAFRRAIGFPGFIAIKIKQIVDEVIEAIRNWFTGWENRIQITIPSDNISADLEYFPVTLVLGDSVGPPSITDVNDSFTGVNGEVPNPELWYDVAYEQSFLHNNKLRLSATGSDVDHDLTRIRSVWFLKAGDDFSVDLDFDIISMPVSTGTQFVFRLASILDAEADFIQTGRLYTTDGAVNNLRSLAYADSSLSGTITDTDYSTISPEPTKLRIVRIDGDVTLYYYNGSWNLHKTITGVSELNGDLMLDLFVSTWTDLDPITVDFDNFTINSGTIVWPERTGARSDMSAPLNELQYDKKFQFFNEDFRLPNYEGPFVNDYFNGADGDLPNEEVWYERGNAASIDSNKLHINTSVGNIGVYSHFYLSGDFDIQVDYDITTDPQSTSYAFVLSCVSSIDTTTWYLIRRKYDTGVYYNAYGAIAGVIQSGGQTSTSDTSGKMRITRSGSSFTSYYWNGSSWTSVDTTIISSDAMIVSLYGNIWANDPTAIGDFDNFKVISADQILWPQEGDDFTGEDGDAPNPNMWRTGHGDVDTNHDDSGTIAIQNNSLDFSVSGAVSNPYVQSTYSLFGDFDIQVDFSMDATPSPDSNWSFGMMLTLYPGTQIGQQTYAYVNRETISRGPYRIGTGTTSYALDYGSTADLSGKFRVVRNASSLDMMMWTGSAWYTIWTDTAFTTMGMYVSLFSRIWVLGGNLDVNFDNFQINYGQLAYPTFIETFDSPPDNLIDAEYNTDVWSILDTSVDGVLCVRNNELYASIPETANDELIGLQAKFMLQGDFDIQVDWSVLSASQPSSSFSYPARLKIGNGDDYAQVAWQYPFDTTPRYNVNSTDSAGAAQYTTSDISGKFRITRVGTVIKCYVWSGSQWEWNSSTSGYTFSWAFSGDIQANLFSSSDFDAGSIVTFDNFIVNSADGIVWIPLKDAFTGTDGYAPNDDLWQITSGSNIINSNKLRQSSPSGSQSINDMVSKFKVYGDFDVQIDWTHNFPATDSSTMTFFLWMDSDNYIYFVLSRSSSAFTYAGWKRVGGTLSSVKASTTITDTTGSFGVVQSSGTISLKYGGSVVGTLTDFDSSTEFTVRLQSYDTSSFPIFDVDWDNFTINSGNYYWAGETHPNRQKLALTVGDDGQQLFNEIEVFDEPLNPTSEYYLGSNRFGDLGWVVNSSPSDQGDYYSFDGVDDYLGYNSIAWDKGDPTKIDIEIRFRCHDKHAGDQGIWKTGGTTNGICIGINASSNIGIFGRSSSTLTSTTTGSFNNNEWYILKASKLGIVLIREADGSILELSGTCTPGVGTGTMTIGNDESIINGTTDGFFDGDIDYVKIYPESSSLRYICGAGYSVLHSSHRDFVISSTEDTTLSLYYDRDQDPNSYYVGNTGESYPITIPEPVMDKPYDFVRPDSVNDDFTGTDGDAPNPELWCILKADPDDEIYISSNKLYMSVDATIGGDSYVRSLFFLSGDFDVQVDFSDLNATAALQWMAGLRLAVTDDTWYGLSIGYRSGSTAIEYRWRDGGDLGTLVTDTFTGTSGKFRMTRVGTSIKGFYWDGSAWEYIGVYTCGTGLTNVSFDTYRSGQAVEISYDNFIVNHGTIVWNEFEDTFTGTDGDAPNSDWWTISGLASILDNTVRLVGTSSSSIKSKFRLSGDFDIVIDLDAFTAPNTNSWSLGLRINDESSNDRMLVTRRYSGSVHKWTAERYISSVWTTVGTFGSSITEGKLRITRATNLFTFYYDIGAGWVSLGTYTVSFGLIQVLLEHGPWETPTEFIGDFDNFKVINGTVLWTEFIETFTGEDGDFPNTELWDDTTDYTPVVSDNTLNAVMTSVSSGNSRVDSKFMLQGDFDIQVDFSLESVTNTDRWYAYLIVREGSGGYNRINREYISTNGGNEYRHASYDGTSWYTEGSYSVTSDTSGKFRITRVGTAVTAYYWGGSSWVTLAVASSFEVTGDVHVNIGAEISTTSQTVDVNFDNFTINSGTIVWPVFQDTFTGEDGDSPNEELWYSLYDSLDAGTTYGVTTIQDNSLDFSIDDTASYPYINSKFMLSGDFDIQVDFLMDSVPILDSNWATGLAVSSVVTECLGTYNVHISRYHTAIGPYRTNINDGTAVTGGSSDTSGKFRIVRSGTTATTYYWGGSGWVSLKTDASYVTDDIYVKLFGRIWTNDDALNTNFDNFTINSGTIKYIPAQQVWDADFKAVYHMAQSPAGDVADSILDSTLNANHGTPDGTMLSEDLVDAGVGKAIEFDGTDDAIVLSSSIIDFKGVDGLFSVDFSIFANSMDIDNYFMGGDTDTGFYARIQQNDDATPANRNKLLIKIDDGVDDEFTYGSDDTMLSKWTVGSVTLSGVDNRFLGYINGSVDITLPVGSVDGMNDTFAIGGTVNTVSALTHSFLGKFSELRMSNIERSAGWVKTTSKVLKDNLLTFGDPETEE